MKKDVFPSFECFKVLGSQQQHTDRLVRNQIEHFAQKKDMEINLTLLRKLVSHYSQTERELFDLNQLKNKFLGMAAHDLRNPLGSIRGFSEILQDQDTGSLNEDQRECIDMIHSASKNMLNLVNELLDVSVIESGKLTLDLKPVSFYELIAERVRLNNIAAQKKNTRLHLDLVWKGEAVFDSARMAQVLDNLISNAVKYSPPNSDIYISLKKEKANALVFSPIIIYVIIT